MIGRVTLWARLFALCFLSGTAVAFAQEAENPTYRIHGQLLDEAGNSCSAFVRVVREITFEEDRLRGLGRKRYDCGYSIEVNEPGVYRVEAMSEMVGTAVACVVHLSAEEPTQEIDLCLTGFGSLRGVVQDEAGRPVPGICVMVLEAGLPAETYSSPLGGFLGRFSPGQRSGGLQSAWTRTDAEGRFVLEYLQETSFDLYLQYSKWAPSSIYGAPVASSVPADGVPRKLVYDRPFLVVRVSQDGAPFDFGPPSSPLGEDRGKWPEEVELFLHRQSGDLAGHGGFLDYSCSVGATAMGAGEYAFPLYAERRYLLGVKGGTQTVRPQEIYVARGSGRLEAKLDLASTPLGTVSVEAVNSLGRPWRSEIRMCLETLVGGVEVLSETGDLGWGGKHSVEVATGNYRLIVEGIRRFSRGCDGTLTSRASCGRYEEVVHVEPGVALNLRCTLPEGAFLEVELLGEASVEVREESRQPIVHLFLKRDRRRAVRPDFVKRTFRGLRARTLQVGDQARSEPLPSGRFMLFGYTEDGKVDSALVDLIDGESTKVVLRF